jgi:glycosyltransferase involved in cell wall biosynthesis
MRVIARMNVGGPAVQVASLLGGLDPDRFEQRLYTGRVGHDETDHHAIELPAYRVATLGRRVHPTDDARALVDLVTAMRRFRPHIVHTHTAKAGVLGRLAASIARVPVRVHTFHGHLLHGYFSRTTTRLVVGVERRLATGTDRLVAVGVQVRDDLLAAGIGRHEQFVVVPPGTVLRTAPDRLEARSRLGLPIDRPVVVYLGRITAIKRPDRLVAVAREVRRHVPDAIFAVCGGGDRLGELTAAAAGELAGTLRLLGWRTDVETVHAAADLALLTSDNEGMPMSLIEAGLAGVPAVTTRVGSAVEVVQEGVTGLVATTDSADLSRCVVRLLRDPVLRQQMGLAAKAYTTERFGAHRLVADTDWLYTSIAVERGWWPATALTDRSGEIVSTGLPGDRKSAKG